VALPLKNRRVYDGSGRDAFAAGILTKGERIADVRPGNCGLPMAGFSPESPYKDKIARGCSI
jgi:hypothetical protein